MGKVTKSVNEEKAKKIVNEFLEVNQLFRLYNRDKKQEFHIKEYLEFIVRKHL